MTFKPVILPRWRKSSIRIPPLRENFSSRKLPKQEARHFGIGLISLLNRHLGRRSYWENTENIDFFTFCSHPFFSFSCISTSFRWCVWLKYESAHTEFLWRHFYANRAFIRLLDQLTIQFTSDTANKEALDVCQQWMDSWGGNSNVVNRCQLSSLCQAVQNAKNCFDKACEGREALIDNLYPFGCWETSQPIYLFEFCYE